MSSFSQLSNGTWTTPVPLILLNFKCKKILEHVLGVWEKYFFQERFGVALLWRKTSNLGKSSIN